MGTMDSTAFRDHERGDGSGKSDIHFNGPGDGDKHGHVVRSSEEDHYVRDVEGNVYVDDGRSNETGPSQGYDPWE